MLVYIKLTAMVGITGRRGPERGGLVGWVSLAFVLVVAGVAVAAVVGFVRRWARLPRAVTGLVGRLL